VQIQVDVPKKVTEEQAELLRRFDEIDGKKGRKNGKKTIFEKVKDIFS
jgi:DnaJ-class molecular chaperone